MMRKIILMALAFIVISFLYADIHTIGTGQSISGIPFYGNYDYGWSKVIYTKDEINASALFTANNILGVCFEVYGNPRYYTKHDQRIYVRHTLATSYEMEDHEPDPYYPGYANFQLVYQGSITYEGGGWYYFEFSSPFTWNGTQNVEFLFENWDGTDLQGYPTFKGSSTERSCAVFAYQMNSFPNDMDGGLYEVRPNIQLVTPATTIPPPVTPLYPANNATNVPASSQLKWKYSIGATGYKLYLGTDNPPTDIANGINLGDDLTYDHPHGYEAGVHYYWSVVPSNVYGNATGNTISSFTVAPDGAIVLGTDTFTQRFPLGSYHAYERSAALYLADELGPNNYRISSLSWYATVNRNASVPTKIFLKAYAGENLVNTSWEIMVAGATLVYNNTHTGITANAWNTIALDNSYLLGQNSNLLVLVERNLGNPGQYSSGGLLRSTRAEGKHLTWSQNTMPTGHGIVSDIRPNLVIQTSIENPGQFPAPATLMYPENNAILVPIDVTLSWASGGGGPTGYKLYFGKFPNLEYIGDLGNTLSWTPPTLSHSTEYGWQVVPYNIIGDAINCPVWKFKTTLSSIITVGEGESQSFLPFFTRYKAARTQMLFSADELNAKGVRANKQIEGIAFNVITWHLNPLDNLMFRIKHTSATTLTGYDNDVESFQTCFLASQPLASLGWNYFWFDQPFVWDGTSNLLIDVSFTNPARAFPESAIAATFLENMTWGGGSDFDEGASILTGESRRWRPNTRFLMEVHVPQQLNVPFVEVNLNALGQPVLNWNEVDGAQSYIILGSPDPYAAGPWSELATVSDTNFVYEGTEKMYFYKVIASSEPE